MKPLHDANQKRNFGFYPSQTRLSAIVVPELDDTFSEDFDSNSNSTTQGDLTPPLVGEDYFSGVGDFQLEDVPTSYPNDGFNSIQKETIINPFPFPGPEDDGSDAASISSMESQLERSPFSAAPKTPTTEVQNNNDLGDAMQKLKNLNGSITKLTKDSGTESIQFSSSSPISDLNSNKQIGRRTMATTANEDEKDVADDSEEYDLWQPLDLESPPTTKEQAPQEDAAFAQFSSIMDDSGPVKPLVAPLKLSKPSKTATQPIEQPSDSSSATIPSIEGNGLDDLVDSLQGQLKNIQHEIEVMAGENAKSINLNSPKQISDLLFGRPDMSTNKSTLEGMAASNILAKLILEYRETKRKLNKTLKQQDARTASSSSETSSDSSSIAPPKPMVDPVMLVDTSSFIFRAYYSNPPIHRARDGMPTGAVMGFCSMLNKLVLNSMLRGETPILIHCLDAPGKSFRNDLYPDYKAHRPPIPLDLVPQFDLINKAVKAYGMVQIQAPGFEADDVIATLATVGSQTEGLDVRIFSGDKDLMQLVTEDDDNDETEEGMVHMVDPMTSKVWNHDMVMDKWGVKASQLGDVLALAGDAADNVPGVPGIGPKIAAQLLQEFGSLESLLDNTDEIPQTKRREKLETNTDSARISRELVDLKRSLEWSQMEAFLPPPTDGGKDTKTATPMLSSTKISELRIQPIQVDRILAFYDDMGFHKLKTQLLDRVGKVQQGSTPSAAASGPPKASKAPVVAATKAAETQATTTKPKAKPNRSFWEKTKRTVPKPEDFKDVPF